MILFDTVTALEILDALRLLEGRRRSAGQQLSAGTLEIRHVAERSLRARSGQPPARRVEPVDDDAVLALLDIDDVSDRLKTSERTVRRYISSGRLKALKVGRLTRIRPVDLEQFIADLAQRETTKEPA